MRNIVIAVFLTALISCPSPAAERVLVAVQPLGKLEPALVTQVQNQIKKLYDVDVRVNPAAELPKEAYYPARGRYRAEKLLTYLDQIDTSSTRVLGVTSKDISTTKGKYPDWGIIGLGSLSGHACVVSTFRMRGTVKKVSQLVFNERCSKVIAHELGHTFGLQHCPNVGCLMQDAKGTVRTIDTEHDFCSACKKHLANLLPAAASPDRSSPK